MLYLIYYVITLNGYNLHFNLVLKTIKLNISFNNCVFNNLSVIMCILIAFFICEKAYCFREIPRGNFPSVIPYTFGNSNLIC